MSNEREKAMPTPVRLPEDMKQRLKHAAIDNRRSLSNEIVHRLDGSLKAEQAQQAASAP